MNDIIEPATGRAIPEQWAAWLTTFNPPGYELERDNYKRRVMAWHWRQAAWDMRLYGLEAQG